MLHSSTINTPLVQSANLNSLISFSIRCVFMTCFSFEFHCRAFDSRQFHFGPINPSVAPTPNPNTPSLPVTTTHTHTRCTHAPVCHRSKWSRSNRKILFIIEMSACQKQKSPKKKRNKRKKNANS